MDEVVTYLAELNIGNSSFVKLTGCPVPQNQQSFADIFEQAGVRGIRALSVSRAYRGRQQTGLQVLNRPWQTREVKASISSHAARRAHNDVVLLDKLLDLLALPSFFFGSNPVESHALGDFIEWRCGLGRRCDHSEPMLAAIA